MALQYDLSLPELMDFFCEGEHQGFPEEGIQGAETRMGMSLPPFYRWFLMTYGKDYINYHFNHLEYPGNICTTYEILEDELRDRAPEFSEYADTPCYKLWTLPRERWGEITDNYLIIWYENQGVWSAGYRVRDLLDGKPDLPVYVCVSDDYTLHPLVSLVMVQASGRLPSTAYDWQKSAAKIKHLKLELNYKTALRYDGDFVYIRPLDEHFLPAPCYYDLSDCRLLLDLPRLREPDIRFCPLKHREVLDGASIKIYGPRCE